MQLSSFRPRQAVWSVRIGGLDRPSHKIRPCWVTLLQPARRAAVLGQPTSFRPHCSRLSTDYEGIGHIEYQAMPSLRDVAHDGWLCSFTLYCITASGNSIPSARRWAVHVRATGTVQKKLVVLWGLRNMIKIWVYYIMAMRSTSLCPSM